MSAKCRERLSIMVKSNNGFEIADYDLKNRGSGSVIGTNQHGNGKGIIENFSINSSIVNFSCSPLGLHPNKQI